MSKCWYCNEEITSGNNPEHLGICDKCYNEMFECGNEFIRNMANKIADLESKLAEKDAELKNIVEGLWTRKWANKYYEMRRKEQPKLLFPDSDEVYERYFELKQQLAEKDKEISEYVEIVDDLHKQLSDKCDFCEETHNQEKISFAVEQLEKVKEYNHTLVFSSSLIDNYIDNQIKQLKEMK